MVTQGPAESPELLDVVEHKRSLATDDLDTRQFERRICYEVPVHSNARLRVINLMVFQFWGVIYSILGGLITAVNVGTVQQVLTSGEFMGGFAGLEQALLLGVASIFYSISIAVIPFLASRIVRGDTFGTIAHVILNKIPLIPRR